MLPSSRPARTVKEDFSFSGLAKIELPNSIHDSLESEFRKSWLSFGEEPEPETRAASLTTVHQTSIQSLSEKIKDSTAAPFVTANNNSDPSFTERPNDSVVSFTALPAVLDVTKPESPMTGTSKNEDDIPLVEEEEEAQYLEGMKLAVVITGLLLTIFLVALDMSIIATAIPQITADFHSLDQIGWYGSSFVMCLAAFVSFWGKSFKYFDLKIAFLSSVLVFEVGSLICGVSNSSNTFIIGRAIQGAGGAGVTSGCYLIIGVSTIPAKVPTMIGMLGGVFSIASVAGPLLGGVLTDEISWRWCFYINLPIGGVVIILLLLVYKTPAHVKRASATWWELVLLMDLPSIVSLVASLICFNLGLEWGGITKDWSSADVVGTLVGAGVLGLVFVLIQWRQGERATVNPRIVSQRTIAACTAFAFFANSSGFARSYNLPIYFQAVDGVSPTESGIRILATILSGALFTLLGSILLGKVGYFMPFLITGSIIMTIGSGLIYSLDIGSSAGEYIGYQVITGVGTGLAVQVPVIVAQSLSATEDVSTATATMLFFQFLSAAIGVGTATSIFNNRLIESLPIHAPTVEVVNVLAVGATGLREAFPSEQLPGVLRSYMIGLKDAWLMGLGFAAVTLITAFLPEWKSIKKPKADTKVDAEAGKRNSAIGDAVKDAAKRNSAIVAVV